MNLAGGKALKWGSWGCGWGQWVEGGVMGGVSEWRCQSGQVRMSNFQAVNKQDLYTFVLGGGVCASVSLGDIPSEVPESDGKDVEDEDEAV